MPHMNGGTATSDPLDAVDYDPIDHLNAIFSNPSTLSSAPAVSSALVGYQNDLDRDIARFVAAQATSDAESIRRVQLAKGELADLFRRIDSVRESATQTEQTITDMTADIKRLDSTKRNLTLSMTALKRLQMLTTAYEQLRGLSKSRQYRECAQLLQAVIQLMAHFKSYRSIDQIANLGKKVADVQRELLEQVCEDFEIAFAKEEIAQRRAILAGGCQVMDALGDHARFRLISWYCNTSLREYRQIFRGSEEAGSLDNISRRYSWFNRMLKTYDVDHAPIFPPHWRVNEMLANAFCESTRDDFKGILQRSARRTDGQTIDVNLLLSALQETLNFEHGLEQRFTSDSRSSVDTMTTVDDKPAAFEQAISEAFEPYLSLWVESQDRQLAALIPKYRQQPLRNMDEDFSPQLVIPSSTELFTSYRLMLKQCATLSTGSKLADLSKTFARYLDQYGQQVLFYFLGDRSGPQGPSIEDIIMILNTTDYCYVTCTQLEEKIKARIDEDFREAVDLQSQADAFMGIAGAAVRALVRKVELECEPAWREMRNMPWARLENVGDQSSYVGELLRLVNGKAAAILALLHKHQYARAFCDNLVDSMTHAYIGNLVQCRPISEVGAEQMLLDSYALKKSFSALPTLSPQSADNTTTTTSSSTTTTTNPTAPSLVAYVKRVNQTMSKLDPLLKTLQVRPSPPEALVQAYLIHIADRSDANFRKILELKGVRKQDQPSLVELFHAHRASHGNQLAVASPLVTPLHLAAGSSAHSASSYMLPSLGGGGGGGATPAPAKFDAASFGSAILSAAKDGVDRFGSPANAANASSSSSASAAVPSTSPPLQSLPANHIQSEVQSGNLNENLRGFGKFFRRDLGAFGRFGSHRGTAGGRTSAEDAR